MYKRIILASIISLALVSTAYAGILEFFHSTPQESIFGGGSGTIQQLDQWKATTTPEIAITQGVYGKSLKLSGYGSGCAQFSATGLLTSTGTDCGTGGGGGTPAGSDSYVQFNNSGAFGADSNFVWKNITKRLGIQVASPMAALHVDATVGDTLDTPATATATLVEDVAIDSPTTASATQIDAPGDSSGIGQTGTQVTDGSALYLADGGTSINTNVYGYKTINGSQYYVGTASAYNFGDNNDANNYHIAYTWSAISGADGYVITSSGSASAGNPNWTKDVGNVTSYNDDGTLSGADALPSIFSTIAFPQFNTSLTGASSGSPSVNYGGGQYAADGSSWEVEVWTYRTGLDGVKYFVTSPGSYGLGTDANDSSTFSVDGTYTIGDGDGQIIILKQNGTPVYGYDGGNSGTISLNSLGTPPATTPAISSYSGITRNFSDYGFVTSPSLKYATTPKTYSFTDTNPANGYVIQHNQSTFGSATGLKVLESSYRNGNIYDSTTVSSFTQTNAAVGGTSVTPNSVGFLSNGANLDRVYRFYANKTINGLSIFSGYITATTTDPNDGKYYVIDLANATVSGATYKIGRSIDGGAYSYHALSGTTYQDNTEITWSNTSSTLTPTSAPGVTARFDRTDVTSADPVHLELYNKTPGAGENSGLSFTSDLAELGRIAIGSGGNMFFSNYNNTFKFGSTATPFVTLAQSGNFFNTQGVSGRNTTFNGSTGGVLGVFDTNIDTAIFGSAYGSFAQDPASAVAIQPKNTTDSGLTLYQRPGASDTGVIANLTNSSNSNLWSLLNNGNMGLGTGAVSNARLKINSGNSSITQLLFANTANFPSSPVAGGLEYQSGDLYLTNASNVRNKLLVGLGSGTNTYYW